jgi:penicillin-binding protein-related factor A (putative recombinase)
MHNGTWVPEASSVDFTGTLAGGRAVYFDAKHVGKLTYSHDPKRWHQLLQLWDHHELGALCFLFVSYRCDRYWLLWPQPSWAHSGRYSVRLTHITQDTPEIGMELDVPEGELPDWLSVVEIQEA